jgi:hypothetical protein
MLALPCPTFAPAFKQCSKQCVSCSMYMRNADSTPTLLFLSALYTSSAALRSDLYMYNLYAAMLLSVVIDRYLRPLLCDGYR